MEAVGDLDGVRRAECRALGVGAGSVAADDLHAGVSPELGGQGRGLSIWQQVEHTVPLQVDEYAAVALGLALRPIVDAEHPDRRCRRVAGGHLQEPQQGIRTGAGGHAEFAREASPRLATEGEPDQLECAGEARGAAGVGRGRAGQPLAEDPAWVAWHLADEAAHVHLEGDGEPVPGKIGQVAGVPALDPPAGAPAPGADRLAPAGARHDDEPLRLGGEVWLTTSSSGAGTSGTVAACDMSPRSEREPEGYVADASSTAAAISKTAGDPIARRR